MRPLALVLFALLAGCPGSLPPEEPPDQGSAPLPDRGALPEAGADSDAPNHDGPGPQPDATQGTSCSNAGITFTIVTALAACGQARIDVTAPTSYSWVLVGITSGKGNSKWTGGVTNVNCGGGSCAWTFPKADVPCEPGPYALSLMRDATNDDPSKGVIEATCTP